MINWVIGSRGLLGSAVSDELHKFGDTWQPSSHIIWAENGDSESIERMDCSINKAVAEFAHAQDGQNWNIYWCAGIGVVNSSHEMLELEIDAVKCFIAALTKFNKDNCGTGKIFFASSAGAVYAGSSNPPFTESSLPIAISDYGLQKLRIEDLFSSYGKTNNVKIVIGRIANLYGTRQNRLKKQGLITTLIQNSLTNSFVNIYVPLNTIRNYIYTDDAAKKIIWQISDTNNPFRLVIICSDNNMSLSSVLRLTQDVTRKRLLYFQSCGERTTLQPLDLRLTTKHPDNVGSLSETSLVVGINNIRLHLLGNLRKGELL
jgi:UDP-glucose 4-epimerase